MDLREGFERASAWTATKIDAAALDAPSACPGWDVRRVVNHLIESVLFFTPGVTNKPDGLLGVDPPDLLGDDASAAYARARGLVLDAFPDDASVDAGGMSLQILFGEFLIHGWDLAAGTGQDATMPPDLAAMAWSSMDGQLPDDKRREFFGPARPVSDDATAQEKLLAYVGRTISA